MNGIILVSTADKKFPTINHAKLKVDYPLLPEGYVILGGCSAVFSSEVVSFFFKPTYVDLCKREPFPDKRYYKTLFLNFPQAF